MLDSKGKAEVSKDDANNGARGPALLGEVKEPEVYRLDSSRFVSDYRLDVDAKLDVVAGKLCCKCVDALKH